MTINGTTNPDNLSYSGSTDETIYGLNADDYISTIGSTANNTIDGGNGNDTVVTGNGNNFIYGGAGNDTIIAGSGNDFIDGGQGNDRITTGDGNDVVVLMNNGGIDTVTDFHLGSGSGPDVTLDFQGIVQIGSNLLLGNGTPGDPAGFYGGLNFNNTWLAYAEFGGLFYPGSGLDNVGTGDAAVTPFNLPTSVFNTAGADFTLKSASMAEIWWDGVEVTINGYDDGNLVATQQVTLGVNPTHVDFVGFTSIDTVTITVNTATGTQVIVPSGGGAYKGLAVDDLTLAFETGTAPSHDVLQVNSQAVADGLLASAHDVAGGVALDYQGYHVVLLGQSAANASADWFKVVA